MTKLRRLINEAKKCCKFRNHKMKRFTHSVPYNGIMWGKAYSECKTCGQSVVCNARPEPNSIEISGEAVALNCSDYIARYCYRLRANSARMNVN